MSYRCLVCLETTKPGQQLLRYTTTRVKYHDADSGRDIREIESEIPVCPACKIKLDRGVQLHELRRIVAPKPVEPAPKPVQEEVFPPINAVPRRSRGATNLPELQGQQ